MDKVSTMFGKSPGFAGDAYSNSPLSNLQLYAGMHIVFTSFAVTKWRRLPIHGRKVNIERQRGQPTQLLQTVQEVTIATGQ
jgi:hypothetical protein